MDALLSLHSTAAPPSRRLTSRLDQTDAQDYTDLTRGQQTHTEIWIRTHESTRRCHKQNPHSPIMRSVVALIAGIVLAFAAHAEPYTAAAMWQLQRLGDPDISPDGRLAVVPVTRFDVDKNKGDTDLWLVPTKPGKARQLTSSGGSASSPVWSPDGEMIAFVGKRGEDKQQQLYVIAVDGGEARRVTNVPTGVIAPKWFPDSRRIAFLSQVWTDLEHLGRAWTSA